MSIIRVSKKIWGLLDLRQRIQIFELLALMLFGAFLETLTVALFSSFVNCIMDTESMNESSIVKIVKLLLKRNDTKEIIIALSLFLAFLYIFKNLYTIWEYSIQYGFTCGNGAIMQNKIIGKLIHRPFEHYLYADSGEMIRFATADIAVVYNMLAGLLNFFTEFIVTIVLVLTAVIQSPSMSIGLAAVLTVSLFVVMKLIKPRISAIGTASREYRAGKNKNFIEIVEGIKEIKVYQKEDYFRERFYRLALKDVKAGKLYTILSLLPKNIIESTAMAGLFTTTAFLLYKGQNYEEIIYSIAVIAMIAMRLLPSMNRISTVLTSIALDEEVVDNVIKVYKEEDKAGDDASLKIDSNNDTAVSNGSNSTYRDDVIELKNITYAYPDSNRDVLSNVSLTIKRGEAIGIVGQSGGGKSTLVNIFLGLLNPRSGEVLGNGKSVYGQREWLSKVGYVPQSIYIIDSNIRENIAFGVPPKDIDDKKIMEVVKLASLDEYVNSLPNGIYSSVGERGLRISGGQRQRIGIARALYFDPEVILFDEATSALDIDTEAEIMNSVEQIKGKITMVIVAHRYTTVMGCNRVYRVQDGEVKEIDKKVLQDRIATPNK